MSRAAPRCPVCGDTPIPIPVPSHATSELVRSPGCGLEWRHPLPDAAALRQLYAAGYFERWGLEAPGGYERVRAMKRASYRRLLDEVRRHRAGGRLLDVGCALGFLVELAGEQGFDAYGIDRSPEAVRLARGRLGDRVQAGELSPGLHAGRCFDVVTLVDVFEHVPDPAALLRAVRERLAPSGVVAAVLPNAASLTRRLLGRRWPHYAPEHLYHWSPGCLKRFLGDSGWELLVLRTGFRKTYTASYLAAYAAHTAPRLRPLLLPLGHLGLRVPTGEMLVLATPKEGSLPPPAAGG